MEQIDYKKKYEEALENFRKIKETNKNNKELMDFIEYEYPELTESEDERIRKALINVFSTHQDYEVFYGVSVEDIRAWLEKQGEPKEINLVDILKHYPIETELYSPLYGKLWLAEVDEKNEIITCYKYPLDEGCVRAILEQEDTVSFYSNGTTGLPDFSISKDCMLFLYDKENQGEQKPVSNALKEAFNKSKKDYSLEEKKEASDYSESIIPTSIAYGESEEEYLLHKIIEAAFIAGQNSKQKPIWSEKDKKMIDLLIAIFEINYPNEFYKTTPANSLNIESKHSLEIINWFKSLKERYTWKPSDEQMQELHNVFNDTSAGWEDSVIESLYYDLKKLREE